MCGFCGFTGEIEQKSSVIASMVRQIIHRGPDSEGIHLDDCIAMGFRRLSIIDLSDGSQPMYNEDNTIVITFNGEIYNYQQLRNELIEKGHIFRTHSDTEVLIHAYEQYGTDMLNMLRGMFAFAIWDSNKKELFAARDYFGIKPFYYTVIDGDIIYSSEIKSIIKHPKYKKELNLDALESYLSFNYSVLEETFFKGIYKLWPAHYMIFKDGKVDIHRYWEPEFKPQPMSFEEAVDKIDDVMLDSIKAHMISDVEVGSFLSSGVDSSYVAACFKGDKTFTVGFDYDNYSEIEYAKELSDEVGIKNYGRLITTEEYWASLPKVQYQMDEPLADASAVALYFLSQCASQQVKVCLSGEGADEVFGGYPIYQQPIHLAKYNWIPKFVRKGGCKIAAKFPFGMKGRRLAMAIGSPVEDRFIGNIKMFSVEERRKLLKNPTKRFTIKDLTGPFYDKVKNADDITKMQYLDMHMWLVGDILLKGDKMSMANSLEVRVPFMDKKVFEVASTIPVEHRVTATTTKKAMRLAALRHMPEKSAKRKKLGFPVPIRVWLREDRYYNKVKKEFTSENAAKFFNVDEIVKILDKHKSGKVDCSKRIWTIFIFLIWYRVYFND